MRTAAGSKARHGSALAAGLAFALLAALACASTASATVLCKTSGEHCTGGTYGAGTTLKASLKTGTKWTLNAGYKTFECEEATIEGEVTSPGGQTAATVAGSVTTLKFGKCNGAIFVLAKGTFTIEHTTGSNGTLTLEGFELSAEACTYGGPAATTLSGGSMASIKASASVPKIKGEAKCASPGTMSAEYTVTAPQPLYVASEVEATVLCKAAENPCPSKSVYGKGQSLALELIEGTLFTFRYESSNYVACTEVLIEGEIATEGGTGVDVSGPVKEVSFGGCSNEVDVLKKGSFSVKYTSGTKGTLLLDGFEIRETSLSCTFTGPASISLVGGEMASAGINSSVTNSCFLPLSWSAEFTVTKPEPLYVSEF